MRILDMAAGRRAVWFNKKHPMATFLDIRPEVEPDIVCDVRAIPDAVGTGYDLVCWDPPHLNTGANSDMAKRYGHFTTAQILDLMAAGGREAHRVTRQGALMALKWNDHSINLNRVLLLLPQWEPLFWHHMKNRGGSDAKSQSFWVLLRRLD